MAPQLCIPLFRIVQTDCCKMPDTSCEVRFFIMSPDGYIFFSVKNPSSQIVRKMAQTQENNQYAMPKTVTIHTTRALGSFRRSLGQRATTVLSLLVSQKHE